MSLTTEAYGLIPSGSPAQLTTIENNHGLRVSVTDWGVTVVRVQVPGPDGLVDLCLGYDSLQGYLQGQAFLGCTVGRFANRIAGGQFTLDGHSYHLHKNEADRNTLHGGEWGFDKKIWDMEVAGEDTLIFRHTSMDGEEGFPGTLRVVQTICVTDDNELIWDYQARTDRATPVNLTNHAYWNLAGGGDVLNHEVELAADHYLPVDAYAIPTGEVAPVADGPMDFRTPHRVGERIDAVAGGYDHCYVLRGESGTLRPCARVRDPESGREMTVETDQPGVQFYTGNFLDGLIGYDGRSYDQHAGFCLETQAYPDAVNQKTFPSTILRPGELYTHRTVHRFSF